MSFEEQERALFDLLFDQTLRNNFCDDPGVALSEYALDDAEINDFREIQPDALKLDASMRAYQILTHICRQYPITLSLISSFPNGNNLLKELINLQTMHCHPAERSTVFGSQLREQLVTQTSGIKFDSKKELAMVTAILEAELGMAWTGATLKLQILEGESPMESEPETCADWLNKPVKLVAYVSAVVIPQSYVILKDSLCPCEDADLWAHLSKKPTSTSRRKKTLATEEPTLFITRAQVKKLSPCDSVVGHKMAELTDGFAPLLQHINGTGNIAHIIEHLRLAGASEEILHGVKAGFQQLLTSGMLEFA